MWERIGGAGLFLRISRPRDAMIAANTAAPASVPVSTPSLTVVLRRDAQHPVLGREQVAAADLADAISEAWRDAYLRKGRPSVRLLDARFDLSPLYLDESQTLLSGFFLKAADSPGGECEFSIRSLRSVAQRAGTRLKELGLLEGADEFVYEVLYEPYEAPPQSEAAPALFDAVSKPAPLHHLRVPIRPLLQTATPRNRVEEGVFPVFYTATAFAEAERCAREGARALPSVETGAVLVGTLCSCPESGEFFCVVCEVFEVLEAEHAEFSLAYTSASWGRIQKIVSARQTVQPALRLLGQCHGHNFLPNDGKVCDLCARQPVCGAHNIFVSTADQIWSRAVFAHQPWQLSHIFGLSARRDFLNGLFTLQDARLRQRGFFVLPEFDPDQWEPGAIT